MTTPTDAAIAQAFREVLAHRDLVGCLDVSIAAVESRACELDAEKGGDANVEAVRAKLLDRSRVGFAKYGVTTERTDLTLADWLTHLQEELMDAAVYAEAAKRATPPAQAAEAVERVARALFGLAQNPATWGWWHDSVRDQYRDQARAAIAAMQAGE